MYSMVGGAGSATSPHRHASRFVRSATATSRVSGSTRTKFNTRACIGSKNRRAGDVHSLTSRGSVLGQHRAHQVDLRERTARKPACKVLAPQHLVADRFLLPPAIPERERLPDHVLEP